MSKERRRAPRLRVLDRVKGQLALLPMPVTLRDIGLGGFAVESASPFPPGDRRLFLFTTAAGMQVIIEGAVAYSRAERTSPPHYITGFRFVHSRLTDTGADIDVLLDALDGVPDLEEEPVGAGG